jgi:hypothetical protein
MGVFHIIFLSIAVCAAVPIIIYYYRRQPNPRFRPTMGEMTLVSLVIGMVFGGGAWGLASLMENPEDFKLEDRLLRMERADETPEARQAAKKADAERAVAPTKK